MKKVGLLLLLVYLADTGLVAQTFFGSTPCDNPVIGKFLNISPNLPCELMKWKVTLTPNVKSGTAINFEIIVSFGMSLQNTNGLIDGGTKTIVNGICKVIPGYQGTPLASVLQLHDSKSGAYISFVKVNENLLQLLGPENDLAVGNPSWSYTLNSTTKNEINYTIENSTTTNKEAMDGVFEGKTPCSEIATQLQKKTGQDCIKLKWRIFFDKSSMTYKMDGSFYREQPRLGKFKMLQGIPSNPEAVVIQLDPENQDKSIYLLKGDNNILFLLDKYKKYYVGNEDFSFTLNRVR